MVMLSRLADEGRAISTVKCEASVYKGLEFQIILVTFLISHSPAIMDAWYRVSIADKSLQEMLLNTQLCIFHADCVCFGNREHAAASSRNNAVV